VKSDFHHNLPVIAVLVFPTITPRGPRSVMLETVRLNMLDTGTCDATMFSD
jgi:hypothetical protein